jgi:hypothetical protein
MSGTRAQTVAMSLIERSRRVSSTLDGVLPERVEVVRVAKPVDTIARSTEGIGEGGGADRGGDGVARREKRLGPEGVET